MAPAAFTWGNLADLALAVFLILAGLALAYALVRLGTALGRASGFIKSAEREILPVLSKLGGTIDRVNEQLDKVDRMTDSAVDAVATVDAALRAVSSVVTRPIQKLAGWTSGARHAASSFRAGGDLRSAARVGREEAARREQDLAGELGEIEEERDSPPMS